MPLAFARLSEQLSEANSQLALWVLCNEMSSVALRCVSASWHNYGRQMQGSSSEENCSWVPQLSRQPRVRFRRCGEVEETESRDYLMPGRKRPASPSHGCCCWDWAPEVPCPQPMLQLMLTAPASPSAGRFLAWQGSMVGNGLL